MDHHHLGVGGGTTKRWFFKIPHSSSTYPPVMATIAGDFPVPITMATRLIDGNSTDHY